MMQVSIDQVIYVIAVREMVGLGAHEAIMTAPYGCYALMRPEEPGAARALYRVRMPGGSIEPRATVGSGDAFLAGFVASRYAGRSPVECLAYGVACGAESTQHLGAGTLDAAAVERQLQQVEIRELDVSAQVS